MMVVCVRLICVGVGVRVYSIVGADVGITVGAGCDVHVDVIVTYDVDTSTDVGIVDMYGVHTYYIVAIRVYVHVDMCGVGVIGGC